MSPSSSKEPVWIEERDVLAIHARMLVLHGGGAGLRDEGLVKSAPARPFQYHAYEENSDIIRLAAIYTAALVRNHPFVDGNKRAGFVTGILFLEMNGYRFGASEEDAAHAVLALAAGTIDEEEYESFLRENAKKIQKRRK